jgi:hypothetical protein
MKTEDVDAYLTLRSFKIPVNIFFVENASTELHTYWRNQGRRVRDNKFT